MSTQLQLKEEDKQEINYLKELCRIAKQSGNYQQMDEYKMLNIMLSAKDLGVSPMKAINGGFYVVNGKISMSTALMTDRIRREGHSIKIIEWSSRKCVIIGKRKDNEDSVKLEYTMEDAQLAGLTNSPTWKRYPKNMLYNRAMSTLARVLFPDVVGAAYSEDEVDDLKQNTFKQETPMNRLTEEQSLNASDFEEIEVAPDPEEYTIKELVQMIDDALEIEEPDYLEEYLEFCEGKIPSDKSLTDIVSGWIDSPAKFLEHYNQWCVKKISKSDSSTEILIENDEN